MSVLKFFILVLNTYEQTYLQFKCVCISLEIVYGVPMYTCVSMCIVYVYIILFINNNTLFRYTYI